MFTSRDISLLRMDVAKNCRKMRELALRDGYDILVTGTVRDSEYQEYVFSLGQSKTAVPTFHSEKAGLAFDICKNKKGEEYSDEGFWKYVGALGKKMGFTWGGDWKSFPDKPHFQWDGGGKYTSADIRRGNYPPLMSEYKEDEMSYSEFKEYMARYNAEISEKAPDNWSRSEREWAESAGIIFGTGSGLSYKSPCTREHMVVFLKRLYDKIRTENAK